VVLPVAFQKHTNNVREIACTVTSLAGLVTDIEYRFPALRPHLRAEDGHIQPFLHFHVNGQDIRLLGNENYAFKDGDTVEVMLPIPGESTPG
jgi:molybdopterin converting factor small subunit